MFDNPYLNPYVNANPYIQPQQPAQPRREVVKVNGENGARAYPMGANSSALLLDESGVILWLVTTDGAGYKTVAPFDISPHQTTPPPDFGGLEERIAKLEERVNATAEYIANAQRSERNTEQPRTDKTSYRYYEEPERPADSAPKPYGAEESRHDTGTRIYQGTRERPESSF